MSTQEPKDEHSLYPRVLFTLGLGFFVTSVVIRVVESLVRSIMVRFKKSRHEAARSAYQEAYQKSESEKPTTQRGDAKKSWKESDRARRVVEREARTQRAAAKARQEAERAREEALREEERARQEAERVRLEDERALEEARREALRKREEYWSGLSGLEFERELGTLCERRGYKVSFTPVSGDGGADLILHKEGKTTVVQCKRHKSPASPAVVRELYGTMVHLGADRAILACTGGFTKGVRDFANGKPIILVSALELARMSEAIEGNRESWRLGNG